MPVLADTESMMSKAPRSPSGWRMHFSATSARPKLAGSRHLPDGSTWRASSRPAGIARMATCRRHDGHRLVVSDYQADQTVCRHLQLAPRLEKGVALRRSLLIAGRGRTSISSTYAYRIRRIADMPAAGQESRHMPDASRWRCSRRASQRHDGGITWLHSTPARF